MSEARRHSKDDGIDVLWGSEQIGDAIHRTAKQVNHLLATGAIPGAKKVGRRWCISKAKLREFFHGLNREAV